MMHTVHSAFCHKYDAIALPWKLVVTLYTVYSVSKVGFQLTLHAVTITESPEYRATQLLCRSLQGLVHCIILNVSVYIVTVHIWLIGMLYQS